MDSLQNCAARQQEVNILSTAVVELQYQSVAAGNTEQLMFISFSKMKMK